MPDAGRPDDAIPLARLYPAELLILAAAKREGLGKDRAITGDPPAGTLYVPVWQRPLGEVREVPGLITMDHRAGNQGSGTVGATEFLGGDVRHRKVWFLII